jgi:DNA repair photolyase
MDVTIQPVKNILTRTSGYLRTVTSHSLQPYRGCSFGNALCGVGCYVRSNLHLTRGRPWGGFLEVRVNAAESYLANVRRERGWARTARGRFGIFLSSSTEPFLPQEARYQVTRSLLEAMRNEPPDLLIVQTHTHRVVDSLDLIQELAGRCELRVHISIETDLPGLPGLPPHASSVGDRLAAAGAVRRAGVRTIVTVSPLLPIAEPEQFFARIAEVADGVVIDHFIQGDGTADGSRTHRTALPAAIEAIDPEAGSLAYRDRMVAIAQRHLPGRIGVNIDGFAGRWLGQPAIRPRSDRPSG